MYFKPIIVSGNPGYQLDDEQDNFFFHRFETMLDALGEPSGYTDRSPATFCFYYTVENVDVALCTGEEDNGIVLCCTSITPAEAPAKKVLDNVASIFWEEITNHWSEASPGETGLSGGKIIYAINHSGKAAITLEEGGESPFSIHTWIRTVGTHTIHCNEKSETVEIIERIQFFIWKLFVIQEIADVTERSKRTRELLEQFWKIVLKRPN